MAGSLHGFVSVALDRVPAAATDAPLDRQLIEAAGCGDLGLVKTLLEKGANVNAKDDQGMTALIAASRQGRVEVAQLLVDRDADVNAIDSAGETALVYAASKGLFEVVKLLVENGAGLGVEGRGDWAKAMAMACENGHTKTVQFLKVRIFHIPRTNWRGVVISCTRRALGVRPLGATDEVIMLDFARRKDPSYLLRKFPVGTTIEVWRRRQGKNGDTG